MASHSERSGSNTQGQSTMNPIQHQMQDQLQTAPGFHDHDEEGGAAAIAADIAYLRSSIVNVVLVGPPDAGDRGWVLVDAGMPLSKSSIVEAAEARFGPHARPSAIIL